MIVQTRTLKGLLVLPAFKRAFSFVWWSTQRSNERSRLFNEAIIVQTSVLACSVESSAFKRALSLVQWGRQRSNERVITANTHLTQTKIYCIIYKVSLILNHPGELAQLGEHLPYKQRVGGSSPSHATMNI